MLLALSSLWGQNNRIEKWREEACNARSKGDKQTAMVLYRKILEKNPDDYDAQLALSRLYVQTQQYGRAEKLFDRILRNDPKDAEALKGLGDVYLYTDRLSKAVIYYKKAIKQAPSEIPFYFALARAYIWSDQLEKAKQTYRKILEIDNTYAEAWQGLGKMYYWTEQPYQALKYYEKALKWDPENPEIKRQYNDIRNETAWKINPDIKKIYEDEENYNINAWSMRMGLSKRITNAWVLGLTFNGDRGFRDFYNYNSWDTMRIYNQAAFKTGIIKNNYKAFIFAAFSPSDNRFSAYGFDFHPFFDAGAWKLNLQITGGYQYFYYWNEVGKFYGKLAAEMQKKSWNIRLNIEGGQVDKALIADVPSERYEEDFNPYYGAGLDVYYKIFSKPLLKISAGYEYLTFAYKSPRYYSPLGRHLAGPGLSLYGFFGHLYIYTDFSARYGIEHYFEETDTSNGQGNGQGKARIETVYLQYLNLSGNAEAGFESGKFSAAVSIGGFHNPYYQNLVIGLNLKYAL